MIVETVCVSRVSRGLFGELEEVSNGSARSRTRQMY